MMRTPKIAATLILSILPVAALAVELPQRYVLTVELAEKIAKEAIAECEKSDVSISASVVNDQGSLVYFSRGNGTGANTVHTSFRKAYTSAALKIPTSVLSRAPEAEGFSQLGKMEDDILLLTGGLPVFYEGMLVGALGLSGAPDPDLEEECGEISIERVITGGVD
ncbi:heme-binding protein [uncultured Roseobacter sp.]|uniref:GlcG/HbpS family heme-binding protein n=1 Tax=uncultured Roseobacter sp. TaxID=114847 RepID=UPI00261D646D|nr:heme-binding protein [uncultured Roseobacter sp.]